MRKRGRPKGASKDYHFYVENGIKGIEQVFHPDGINASYNVLRRNSTEKNWLFYKSAYTLEKALRIYEDI
jgi:hypothetical protein